MTVMGTPDSSIECSFRKKDTRELITVSLVRHTKGGAGSQAQTSEKISQAEMNHPMALCNQKSAAADPIDSNQLVRQRYVSSSLFFKFIFARSCDRARACVSPADEES
jgi:hypothetical protein